MQRFVQSIRTVLHSTRRSSLHATGKAHDEYVRHTDEEEIGDSGTLAVAVVILMPTSNNCDLVRPCTSLVYAYA